MSYCGRKVWTYLDSTHLSRERMPCFMQGNLKCMYIERRESMVGRRVETYFNVLILCRDKDICRYKRNNKDLLDVQDENLKNWLVTFHI